MLLFYFKPICFQYYTKFAILENIFLYGKILSAIVIIFYTIISSFPTVKINHFYIKIFLFEFWIFLVTIINKGAVFRSLIDAVSTLTLVLSVGTFYKINSNKLLSTFKNLLLFLVVLQLGSELLFPNGMPADLYTENLSNPLFFVTLDNGTTCLTCLTLTLIELYDILVKKGKKVIVFFQKMLCVLTAILSGSSTAMICTVLLLILLVVSKEKILKVFDKWWIWLILYFFIIFLIVSSNSLVLDLINLITGKSSYTGRNLLWNNAIELIKCSPLIGYGRITNGYIKIWGDFFSSHNFILEMILQGGFVAFFLWLSILFNAFSKLKYINDTKIKRIMILSIFVVLIGLSMEAQVHSPYLFVIISLLFCQFLDEMKKMKYR